MVLSAAAIDPRSVNKALRSHFVAESMILDVHYRLQRLAPMEEGDLVLCHAVCSWMSPKDLNTSDAFKVGRLGHVSSRIMHPRFYLITVMSPAQSSQHISIRPFTSCSSSREYVDAQ